ncbi:MAG: ABC transporter ATP-binding protein, partial [Solobacterium sp.]|nr:ABC transporter ATP-binding protein [Solobacterium sp.]
MIEVNHLTYEYEKGIPVLEDISFTVEDGECVGLIGANGAGKSTLMKIMLGLLDAKGCVKVDGTPVTSASLSEIRRKLGFVLQNSDNQMFMPTVKDDILFGLLNYGMSRKEAEEKADQVLEMLHITGLKDRYNHRISGGEKRMAAIAAVLAMEPSVLLMDEPTSTLDPKNRRMIINTINSLK